MRTLLVLFVFVASINIGMAQIGPFHKNQKPWQKVKTNSLVLTTIQKKDINNGLFLKNQKSFEKRGLQRKVVDINTRRNKIKGPKAKNLKRF